MAKYNDEVWMDEGPQYSWYEGSARHQTLNETAPYTFKKDKRTGWETRNFSLDEVGLASLKSKLKRFKWKYDSEAWIMATDENGQAVYSRGGEGDWGTLRDINKAVSVIWERPYDKITEYYKKPGWNPKRRRR